MKRRRNEPQIRKVQEKGEAVKMLQISEHQVRRRSCKNALDTCPDTGKDLEAEARHRTREPAGVQRKSPP